MTTATHKLNESFSVIDAPTKTIKTIYEFLRVERPGAWYEPAVKAGFKSPYEYFASIQNNQLLVMNGHLDLLGNFGIQREKSQSDFSESEINEFLRDVKKTLPFPPYDFQEKAFKESLMFSRQINRMATGSGKSLTISLIAEFFRRKGMRGLLLVPNINLLTQFKNDIADYDLQDLHEDTHVIGGGSTLRHFDSTLTISTWQSLLNHRDGIEQLDYVICDEAHRFASTETGAIVRETINTRYKWGFTGTLPEDPVMKMELVGLFGLPKTYITSYGLIERGLATPVKINAIHFKYKRSDKNLFKALKQYTTQLKFIKEHITRNDFIVKLTCKLRDQGNSLVLFQHTQHGKDLFIDTMKRLYPDVEVESKNITGKNSFEFQEEYGVYFLNGEDDAKTRELTRKVLEEQRYVITLENGNTVNLHADDEVLLSDGETKLVKNLTTDDEIDDDFLISL